MKISTTLFITISIFLLASCQKDQSETSQNKAHTPTPTSQNETDHRQITQPKQNSQASRVYGKVTEILNTTGYTYIQVDDGKTLTWAAGPTTPVSKGDMIAFDTGMAMRDFHSKSMNRDFDVLYFVDRFIDDKVASKASTKTGHDAMQQQSQPHGQVAQQQSTEAIKGIEKIKGGNTIAEIFTNKQSLKDKITLVRGKVTKFTGGVLGKNWLHIRDSSTLDDLTVTTSSTVKVGDIIVAEGKLGLDKDFSYGYVYPVILEDAKIIKK